MFQLKPLPLKTFSPYGQAAPLVVLAHLPAVEGSPADANTMQQEKPAIVSASRTRLPELSRIVPQPDWLQGIAFDLTLDPLGKEHGGPIKSLGVATSLHAFLKSCGSDRPIASKLVTGAELLSAGLDCCGQDFLSFLIVSAGHAIDAWGQKKSVLHKVVATGSVVLAWAALLNPTILQWGPTVTRCLDKAADGLSDSTGQDVKA